MPLQLGTSYTREQIHTECGGGDLQSYLPHLNGNVLCGCFDPKMNCRAPCEIDLGDGRDVIRYAQKLLQQGSPVPVFLRRDVDEWEYVGRFRGIEFSQNVNDLYPAKDFRRDDAIAVLYLEEEPETPDATVSEDPSISDAAAAEGGAALATHLRRERRRQLTEAKRRAHRAVHGQLACEACDLREEDLPPDIGEGCFEVHHTIPIGQRQTATITKLDELVLVCANCHRLLHRSNPMLFVHELRRLRAHHP